MNLDELLLNERTSVLVDQYLKNPTHAMILIGPTGAGKQALAERLASKLLGLNDSSKLTSYAYFDLIEKQAKKQDISIDAIRKVIHESELVIPGAQKIKRVILIVNAGDLSLPAQNALLKILEEPPIGTVFILTAASEHDVLPTIGSRVQKIEVGPVGFEAAKSHFSDTYSSENTESAWRLSHGYIGLMTSLLSDDSEHPLKQAVEQAKKVLQAKDTFERQLVISEISEDKEQFKYSLQALDLILAALLNNSLDKDKAASSKLLKQRREVKKLQEALAANGNLRLIAIQLATNLRA